MKTFLLLTLTVSPVVADTFSTYRPGEAPTFYSVIPSPNGQGGSVMNMTTGEMSIYTPAGPGGYMRSQVSGPYGAESTEEPEMIQRLGTDYSSGYRDPD